MEKEQNADFREISQKLDKLREAQKKFSSYTQEQVDYIFKAAASAANRARIPLAEAAVRETGMGITEDKVIKNHFAAEYIYNTYKNTKTCGIIEENRAAGFVRSAEPVGVIAAVIPTTNPTSTTIFKTLISLKTRNAILISPHPRAKKCTAAAARIVLAAAVKAGAPEGIIAWIDEPTVETTAFAMRESDLILATGGLGMVKSAYSSGRPALGVGAGNTPAVIDSDADIVLAVNSIIHSKIFDNGMICASEQSVIAADEIYDAVKDEFKKRGCVILSAEQKEKVGKTVIVNGSVNPEAVGKSAFFIAKLAGIDVPPETKILIGEATFQDPSEPLANEKLAPVLALYRASDFEDALSKAKKLIENGGLGHTAALYTDEAKSREKIEAFRSEMKTCRILLNTPAAQGAIGDIYNFMLTPSLTLGCGTWGGNSVSENVGVKNLLNIKTLAERRKNMLWFRTPPRIYLKRGCLAEALSELRILGKKRAFVVTDAFLYESGMSKKVTDILDELGIFHTVFYDVEPDPTLDCARKGAAAMSSFKPDTVIALGGGSAMDAAKIMWVLFEHPDADFEDMSMRFADIRKRIYSFPKMGEKAYFAAIPTSAGTGSEVTPFAVITDESSGGKYPLADYELMPDMAIIDCELMMNAPKSLTAAAGFDALTHALEAYASMMSTDYTDALALHAMKLIFEYLPRAYENGAGDAEAREKTADAATMAGMAFANAFLGLCHSAAHKLGAAFHLPHGISNALLIEEVMRFNAAEAPTAMGTFPQYSHPHTLKRYAEIADFLRLGGDTDDEKFEKLADAVRSLREKLGIKASLRDYGIREEEFLSKVDRMSTEAFDDQCTPANPRYPHIDEIREIYMKVYYGNDNRE